MLFFLEFRQAFIIGFGASKCEFPDDRESMVLTGICGDVRKQARERTAKHGEAVTVRPDNGDIDGEQRINQSTHCTGGVSGFIHLKRTM